MALLPSGDLSDTKYEWTDYFTKAPTELDLKPDGRVTHPPEKSLILGERRERLHQFTCTSPT